MNFARRPCAASSASFASRMSVRIPSASSGMATCSAPNDRMVRIEPGKFGLSTITTSPGSSSVSQTMPIAWAEPLAMMTWSFVTEMPSSRVHRSAIASRSGAGPNVPPYSSASFRSRSSTACAARSSSSAGSEGISGSPPANEMRWRGSGVAAAQTWGPRMRARALTSASTRSGVQYGSVIGQLRRRGCPDYTRSSKRFPQSAEPGT